MLLVTSRSVSPTILRAGAVDIDVEGGSAERLLDARVDEAGNVAQPAQQQLRISDSRSQIGAANLQVDRRRRAEIQDLADDVGRQKRERRAGKALRQFLAHARAHNPRSADDFRSSLIWISPSCVPIVPVLL